MLEGLNEDPNTLSAFSVRMLDINEWGEAKRVLDPQISLH